MQTTNHARERYCERVLNIPQEEIKAYLAEHGAEVDQAILAMYEQAEHIWTKENTDFYINDIFLLVIAGHSVPTIVKCDYGFDEALNRQIVGHQIEKIREMREHQARKTQKTNRRLVEIKSHIGKVDNRIKLLESKIREEQANRRQLAAHAESIEAELDVLQKAIDQECYKLVYSTAFKMDELRTTKKRGA